LNLLFHNPRPARIFSYFPIRVLQKIDSLTDSPATLYRCDPIEGKALIPYSQTMFAGFGADKFHAGVRRPNVATCAISATEANVIPSTSVKGRDDSQINLVKRAQAGDEQAFATLFQQHKNRVYSVCLLMTKDVAEAEDLTQEAFLQVFRTVGSFRGDAAFSTWLYRVAVNTVLMKLRRRKSPPTVSLDEPVHSESPSLHRDFGKNDPDLSGVVDRIALRRALQELPEGCRRIFALHEVEGYQHHEIAQLLDCSIGNSKSQLHKAKLKMRSLLFPKTKIRRRQAKPMASVGDEFMAVVKAAKQSR
jgi:RNA polymerase sigma-70 factor (ECF subfamily)